MIFQVICNQATVAIRYAFLKILWIRYCNVYQDENN